MLDIESLIRDVPDFPREGILFKDITPLLANGPAWKQVVDRLADRYRGAVDVVLGVEARGFLFGSALAYALGCGHAIVRKPGKLPAATFEQRYELEYGTDSLEIHQDAFPPHSRVVLVDDLLATGGTARAAIALAERLGATLVEAAFLVELSFLDGRARLAPCDVFSFVRYDGD